MAENSWSLGRALRGMFVKPTIDETTWDDLETAMITADFGPDITERVVDELRGELRDASQLIVITHQKRTMEIADALYGVSMRQDGVSAVVGQRVGDRASA